MDRELLSYLADLAAVRNHINTILNVGRGVIDKKSLHQVSARANSLDTLFVNALLSGRAPSGQIKVEDDYEDIRQRVLEEKAKLAGQPIPTPQAATAPVQLSPAQKALLADEEDDTDTSEEKSFTPPKDELKAVQELLEKAEKQVRKKK